MQSIITAFHWTSAVWLLYMQSLARFYLMKAALYDDYFEEAVSWFPLFYFLIWKYKWILGTFLTCGTYGCDFCRDMEVCFVTEGYFYGSTYAIRKKNKKQHHQQKITFLVKCESAFLLIGSLEIQQFCQSLYYREVTVQHWKQVPSFLFFFFILILLICFFKIAGLRQRGRATMGKLMEHIFMKTY